MTEDIKKTEAKEDAIFNRQDFMNMPEPKVSKVFVKELQSHVYMKEMTAAEQDGYDWSVMEFIQQEGERAFKKNLDTMRSKYLVRVLCNRKGQRLFGDDEFEILGRKKRREIQGLYREALKVNGAEEEAVEEQRKN